MADANEELQEEIKKLKQQLEKTEHERDSALNHTESLQSDIRNLMKELAELRSHGTGLDVQEMETIDQTTVEDVQARSSLQGGDEEMPLTAGKERNSPDSRACGSLKSCSCLRQMMIKSTYQFTRLLLTASFPSLPQRPSPRLPQTRCQLKRARSIRGSSIVSSTITSLDTTLRL